ncbi:unnamed protein product [Amaranthus hypochondriacus]
MKEAKGESSNMLTEVADKGVKSAEDIFLNSYAKVSLSDLAKLEKAGTFVTIATIVAIDPDHPWYYNSCNKCFESICTDEEGSIFCRTCKSKFEIAYPRYKIFVKVIDAEAKATFMLFDTQVKKELVVSANEIREKQGRKMLILFQRN